MNNPEVNQFSLSFQLIFLWLSDFFFSVNNVLTWHIGRICLEWKIAWCVSMAAQLYISQETEFEFEW